MRKGTGRRIIVWCLGTVAALVAAVLGVLWIPRVDERPDEPDEVVVFYGQAQPPLDAVVQAVTLADSLAVLSVGRDQNVQMGSEFTVVRGGRSVGKLKVIKVYQELSGARILSQREGEEIRVGDRATTGPR